MTVSFHPRVLEFMASRICHDLVSPVGAVTNGVELIEELGEEAGAEAMQLIASSATQASFRLKAFRLGYGAAGTDKNIGFKDIKEAFLNLIGAGHVTAEFEDDLVTKFSMPPRGFFKCLLNLLILAEECNHGEGRILVTATDDVQGMQVTVTGKNPSFREGEEAALKGEASPEDLDPRSVHGYITGKFIAWFDLNLTWEMIDDSDEEPARLVFQLTF